MDLPWEKPSPSLVDITHFTPLHTVTAVKKIDSGVELTVDDALLRIDILRPDLLRIRITRTGLFEERPTFAVAADVEAMRGSFNLLEFEGEISLVTAQMKVRVGREPFRIDAYRADGSAIFETAKIGEHYAAYAYLNDEFFVARKCRLEDAILGLGEKTGRMNRKGRNFTLWCTDVLNPTAAGQFTRNLDASDPRSDPTSTEFDPYYISIPFFHHLSHETGAASGFFIDNGYRGHFEFERAQQYRFHFTGGEYTEYVFAGPSLRDILSSYTELTGRMAAPPIWALGYHQCRWRAYTQADIEQMADRFREYDIPCDTLWLDIDYMDGYRVFTWNTETYPNPPAMLDHLREQGMRSITIIDPGVKFEPGYRVFDEGLKRDVFCKTDGGNIYLGQVWPGKTAFPDFVTAEARSWWGELNAEHVKSGLAGIWNDMNEPATGDIAPDAMRFDNGRYPHERFHNQYALLMAMGTVEGLLSAMPDRRTFVLSRAGFAGIQRYAANWMGDNMARWEHLWMSVPMALGIGLSGQPFVGADIGGFAECTTSELLTRWMQSGALTAFCRNHNVTGCLDQYPWSFGEAVQDMIRDSLKLRYCLMPAIYTAFMESSETGAPVQRPLVLEYQQDRTARDIDDQYLLGPNLLVAPVYTQGATARQVYLPKGSWHNWFTGKVVAGPRFVTAPTPMDHIPVYARGGAVIPMWPDAPRSTMDYHPDTIELHVFIPLEDGEFSSMLHEDDGITFGFRDGAFLRTVFTLRRDGSTLELDAATSGGGYGEFKRSEFMVVFHGPDVSEAQIGGENVTTVSDNTLRLPNSGQSFRLRALLAS